MITSRGQILRALGLLIELLGVIAVVVSHRTNGAAEIPVLGSQGLVKLGWGAVAGGFVMWLAGRILIERSNRAKADRKRAQPLDQDVKG
jgi:hypothetical protein